MSYCALLVAALALAGCGRGGDRADATRDTGGVMGRMDSGGMAMGDMPMQGMQMMSNMRAHMDSMIRMSPQQMEAMMARHEQMMSQMMDQMGGEMRQMKMSETPEWSALTDSVKQDLAELPGLKGRALSTRMRAHTDRVQRLITAHEGMMKGMR
jgi:hypothetical protein